jgi:DNA-directed RNA polymerase subunit M/transcription elongation factor TFIIS
MASIVYGLLLLAKGDVKRVKVLDTKVSKTITVETLQDILKKKTKVSELGTYPFGSLKLTLFGYTTGKAGTENKHELPPPLDATLYFSDILVIGSIKSSSWKTPVSLTTEQYEKWYQNAFGGFEDIDTSDSEEDEEEDEEAEEEAEDEAEELEEMTKTKKKKVAEEDGVPEDEVEADIEDDEEDDEDENDDTEDEIAAEEDQDVEQVIAPKKKTVKKKKPVKPSYTANTNALSQQYILQERLGFKEISSILPIEKTSEKEKKARIHVFTYIQTHFGRLFKKSDQLLLEQSILKSAMKDATTRTVLKHFDNPMFEVLYMTAARRIIGNLSVKSYIGNQTLLQKVLQGALSIETLADMEVIDYAPQIYAPLRERMILREQHQLEGNKAMATDLFKCGRCHKKECTYYELQTRSADEPMTKFITCLNCGNHWRM